MMLWRQRFKGLAPRLARDAMTNPLETSDVTLTNPRSQPSAPAL